MVDVAIIGGGIIGAMTARALSRTRLDTVVLERAYDVGEAATKANSGVVAAGFHPRGGSLKGVSCVQGNLMFPKLCDQLGVPFARIGSLFVAFHEEGRETLQQKLERGLANGATGLRIIEGEEARAMEPALSKRALAALYAPNTGIVSPFQLVWRTAQCAHNNGVRFQFQTEVERVEDMGGYYRLHTSKGSVDACYVVNAAGEMAAIVERHVRPADLIVKPRRGQFYVLDKQGENGIRHVLYQAQESDEGGTFITPTVDGNLLIGPTSENVPSFHSTQTTRKGLAHLEAVAHKLLPELDLGQAITNFAGVRANITNVEKEKKDFVLRVSAPRMVSALGIKNPGMTASPYLAERIVQLLQKEGLVAEANPAFDPVLPPQPRLVELPHAQQQAWVAKDPAYGRIVCRCEQVTEGDILAVLRQPLPPHSLNGMKKRLRTGMGRCQGGFCTPRLLEILSREWGVPPREICKGTSGSVLVKGRVK